MMLTLYLSMLVDETDKLIFEKLYQKYEIPVLKYAKSQMRHQQNAEDVAHDVWLLVIKDFGKYEFLDETAFRNYLMKMVRNRAISLLRRKETEMKLFVDMGDDFESNAVDKSDGILLSLCEKEDCQAIIESMKELDAHYRDVLNLFYLQGSTPKEIAKILCLKDGTVRQRLSRGRQKLLEILQEKGIKYEYEFK